MTQCVIGGGQCQCQPDDGMACPHGKPADVQAGLCCRIAALEADLAAAQARIQALEQDAERYRWLRDYGGRTRYPDVVLPGITHRKASLFGDETFELLIGRAADAAIDSARGGA